MNLMELLEMWEMLLLISKRWFEVCTANFAGVHSDQNLEGKYHCWRFAHKMHNVHSKSSDYILLESSSDKKRCKRNEMLPLSKLQFKKLKHIRWENKQNKDIQCINAKQMSKKSDKRNIHCVDCAVLSRK